MKMACPVRRNIEAKIGAEYFVRCTNTRPQPTILKRLSTGITKALNCMKATISIDGQAATTSRLVTVGSVKHLRLRSGRGTVEQNFVFCAPHVTDDGISCSSKLKDVGRFVD
ncbi:hypothetical protein, variant 2 [Aphanomyces astaci]|uniref:Uncharacterized protein n=1 Tax=Aphanomyces astaci TaxID=112090 RepID=W4FZZ7_APHAT|nr:hypothetical protein H257_12337 [Aphanomyces astaci]XP_009837800.1 hypothetical protein, variant 1 [Aphanomyces astaci]XP_009837801.1 hypothetical protein, variant 2 [Aphanomyces astaci]ETV72571.1 hypothetical protein H257_12337 [Aphanomyces astaci]ETV72572.1 hypothetical protein, variant 1 [Aphanomyces astaci]ETV72573.1 hypothetical protein, variant 2 [Aphanomyces astaci]|eukprot:XP_009837799.1 hypothetical protein H257_12337 [Aphanomyces astaci]